MARDAGGPAVSHQVLIYPDLDFRRCNVSIQEFAGKYGNISRATQQWFMNHYLNDEHEKLDAHVSPLLSPSLEGLPPALIVTAEYDALRDEGEAYGARLQASGVRGTVLRYDGMIHEFIRWPFDDADRALDDIAAALTGVHASPERMRQGDRGDLPDPLRSPPTLTGMAQPANRASIHSLLIAWLRSAPQAIGATVSDAHLS